MSKLPRRPPTPLAPLPQRWLSGGRLRRAEEKALADTALALKAAAIAGTPGKPLRGKQIALLCTSDRCEPALIFEQAASELGARVSRVLPLDMSTEESFRETARMLGRLYDAVECDHLSPDEALRLQRDAGVPVFNGLARPEHPVQRIAVDPAGTPDPIGRGFLVKAALLKSMA